MKNISLLMISLFLFSSPMSQAQPRFADDGPTYSLEELAAVVIGSKDTKTAIAALDVLTRKLGQSSDALRSFLALTSRPSYNLESVYFRKEGDPDLKQVILDRYLATGEYPSFYFEEATTPFELAVTLFESPSFENRKFRAQSLKKLLSTISISSKSQEMLELKKFGPFFVALFLFYEFDNRELGFEGLRFIREKTNVDTFIFQQLLLKIRGRI
jgi:hypothetical protein